MNCKQGDIAVIVRSLAGNEGRLVICVELCQRPTWLHKTLPGPTWRIDRFLDGILFPTNIASDSQLRPLRDDEGEDEMLRITGRPLLILEKA